MFCFPLYILSLLPCPFHTLTKASSPTCQTHVFVAMETVHFEVAISGFRRDDYNISMHGVVRLNSTIREALANVQIELANNSFLAHAQKLLLEHCLDTEQCVRLEIFQNGMMVSIPWDTIVSSQFNRTYYINIEDVSLIHKHIDQDPEAQ